MLFASELGVLVVEPAGGQCTKSALTGRLASRSEATAFDKSHAHCKIIAQYPSSWLVERSPQLTDLRSLH